LLPALLDVNTSRRYSGNFIGYRCTSARSVQAGNPGIPITIRQGVGVY